MKREELRYVSISLPACPACQSTHYETRGTRRRGPLTVRYVRCLNPECTLPHSRKHFAFVIDNARPQKSSKARNKPSVEPPQPGR